MSELRYGVLTLETEFMQQPKRRRGRAVITCRFKAGTVLLIEETWRSLLCVPVYESAWECVIYPIPHAPRVRFLSPLEELAMESL